jgi:hypothetical protein
MTDKVPIYLGVENLKDRVSVSLRAEQLYGGKSIHVGKIASVGSVSPSTNPVREYWFHISLLCLCW